jgi:hypothetical protein
VQLEPDFHCRIDQPAQQMICKTAPNNNVKRLTTLIGIDMNQQDVTVGQHGLGTTTGLESSWVQV